VTTFTITTPITVSGASHRSSYGKSRPYYPVQAKEIAVEKIQDVSLCTNIFSTKKSIVLGKINNINDVKKLETFLNDSQGEKLAVNGIYEKKDFEAVKRFQQKYFKDIISPFNGKKTTGIVAQYTRSKINLLNCTKPISKKILNYL
jgi:hypothetical protein